ncbi:hypothetical protein AAL_01979 [Moelleriella libera RCEF 2490]|uniref:Uncharacterized protein n=1 Tax=Moelleriella libera RCEF 2490 TaxID=1081109 RepID=A0A168F2L4_9HYPO|nr:hypothetical protein AAL_01979 [Moelleriella libera RCEF 2490]
MESRLSYADSDTTYHSFHDIELQEPACSSSSRSAASSEQPVSMQRQDSGYESHVSTQTPCSQRTCRSGSTTTSTSTAASIDTLARSRAQFPRSARARPSRRATTSSPSAPTAAAAAAAASYFHFPNPELPELREPTGPSAAPHSSSSPPHGPVPDDGPGSFPLPPVTQHYWTSDHTRRLEYAAIDAASRGVKGWVRRHLVPDCFSQRHVAFDDDSGSVRRYRLELEDEDEHGSAAAAMGLGSNEKRQGSRPRLRRRWFQFSLRKSRTL